jgi:hypothetical protein
MKNLLSRLLIALGIMMVLSACIGAGTIYADLGPISVCLDEAGNPIRCVGDTTAVPNSKCVEGGKCGGPRSLHSNRCRKEDGTVKGECINCSDTSLRGNLCVDTEEKVNCNVYNSGQGSGHVLCGFIEPSECKADNKSVTGATCYTKNPVPDDKEQSTCKLRTCNPAGTSISENVE